MRSYAILFLLTGYAIAADRPEPRFRGVTIDDGIQIGYGLAVADVDGDKRPDILLADKRQIVWYRNPTGDDANGQVVWKKHVIAENLTEKDNVCIAAQDIDGDGKCEVAVGAEWNPGDTEHSGEVFYLIAPEDRTQPWTPVKFPEVEPTTHRMKWIALDATHSGLAVVPLHGRGNKAGEGVPVKVLLYLPPTPLNDPAGKWSSEVIDETMHATHNFNVTPVATDGLIPPPQILLGGREGVSAMLKTNQTWIRRPVLTNEGAPGGFRGAGEVRTGNLSPAARFLATIEPMHGNELVVYTDLPLRAGGKAVRRVLTDKLNEGHALAIGDVLGIGPEQVVVGWRGTVGKSDSNVGVHVWTPLDFGGEQWRDSVVDAAGMACEDLQLADLDGDGRLDIIAAGRATHNVKVYFNETPR